LTASQTPDPLNPSAETHAHDHGTAAHDALEHAPTIAWNSCPRSLECADRAGSDYPAVHLFDEPQFNTQDGYIGFMLEFFRRLRREGRLVFLCVHPNEPFHLEILQEICERFLFVRHGSVTDVPDFASLTRLPEVRSYLGHLLEAA
jgi:hypothetical protein